MVTPRKGAPGESLGFLRDCIESNIEDCLPWPFSVSYGRALVRIKNPQGRPTTVNAQAFVAASSHTAGVYPPGQVAKSTCENKLCCNPNHLRWEKANMPQSKEPVAAPPPPDPSTLMGRKALRRLTRLSRFEATEVRKRLLDGEDAMELADEYEVGYTEIRRYAS